MTRERRIKILKIIANHFFAVGVLLVLTFARIDASISPFALAFLFACFYLPVNKITVMVVAFLFSLFVGTGQTHLISSGFAVAVFLGLTWALPRLRQKYGHKKRWQKFKLEYVIFFTVFILANALNIVFSIGTAVALFQSLVSVFVGVVFLAACVVLVYALRTRGGKVPWTIDQKICLGVFVTVCALGLGGFENDYFSVHKFISVFVILAAVALFDVRTGALMFAVCFGLGRSLVELDLSFVAIYALVALAAIAFKARQRYLSVIAVLVTDVVLFFYFEAYNLVPLLWALLPTVAACVLCLVMPVKRIRKLFSYSHGYLSGYLVTKNTINKNRAGIYGRLNNLAEVFNEMQHIYRGLIQGAVPPEDSAKMIAASVVENVCDSCPNKPNCKRDGHASTEVEAGLQKLAFVALERGAVNFLDLPPTMTMKCSRLNAVLNMANSLVEQTRVRERSNTGLDASKVLMAGLLSGVSKLCRNFAAQVCAGVVFDHEKAAGIKDELLCAGITASDCLITKTDSNEYNVSVLVPRVTAQSTQGAALLCSAVSRVAGHNMQVDSVDDGDTAGFSIVTVKTAPRYALTFGVAQVAKDFAPQNGDTFSFLKITHDKAMMALCDGMGSGERARKASVLALSLVENFYKAGFPNEIIMQSVNQLLTITIQEVFSALDIVVFNLADGSINLIKVGAVDGFIKRPREVEVVEAGSLPLGIVEEMVPKITRACLGAGDMVVLVSDGVVDSFGDRVTLANFINNATAKQPQALADEIMSEALRRQSNNAIDDCTVVTALLKPAAVV